MKTPKRINRNKNLFKDRFFRVPQESYRIPNSLKRGILFSSTVLTRWPGFVKLQSPLCSSCNQRYWNWTLDPKDDDKKKGVMFQNNNNKKMIITLWGPCASFRGLLLSSFFALWTMCHFQLLFWPSTTIHFRLLTTCLLPNDKTLLFDTFSAVSFLLSSFFLYVTPNSSSSFAYSGSHHPPPFRVTDCIL